MLHDFMDDEAAGRTADVYDWIAGRPSTRRLDRMRTQTPELYQAIQVERNEAWAERIDGMLEGGGTTFVFVGLNHVLGPDGIPAQLQKKGMTLQLVQ